MERPRIVAKVTRSLKQEQWIDIYADGWLIASIWGTAKVTYDNDPIVADYRLNINNTDIFLYADAIERRKEAVEPIKPGLVKV